MRLRTRLSISMIRKNFHKRFDYARLTQLPVIGTMMRYAFFAGDDIMILPKADVVRSISTSIDVGGPQDIVLPSDVVRYLIRKAKHIWIMNECICRTTNNCQSYPHDLGCIFLGPGTERIDSELGHAATTEEALDHVDRCEKEGLVHLIGRNKIDSVWLSTGAKEGLLTICHCCECCCLWKMLPNVSESISKRLTHMPGASIHLDASKCLGCGDCVESCFVGAISVDGGVAKIDEGLCRCCGRCVGACDSGALSLELDGTDFIESTLRRLEPLVDVTL